MKKSRGFTLIELSITLTIMALSAVVILAGSDMIKESEVRQVVREVGDIRSAFARFEVRYGSLPGDMDNANNTFGNTADGNGDRWIDYNTGGGDNEALLAWQHLTQSGTMLGKYSGTGTSQKAEIGENIPPSVLQQETTGFSIDSATDSSTWSGGGTNILILGAENTTIADDGSLTPIQALTIDAKIDDGDPTAGIVWGMNADNADDDCVSAGAYTSDEDNECIIAFVIEESD